MKNKWASDKKIAALKCTLNLTGHLAVVESRNKMNLKHVFSYPLTPVPLSLCEGDGTMAKTSKCTLLQSLESRVEKSSPESVSAAVVDGNYLLHTLPPNMPATYGGLAASILTQAVSLSHNASTSSLTRTQHLPSSAMNGVAEVRQTENTSLQERINGVQT